MKPNPDIRRAAAALDRATRLQPGDMDHPGYEALEALVDGRLTDVDREVVDAHVAVCATCAEDVADMAGVRDSMRVQAAVPATRSTSWKMWQIAAAVLAVVAIGAVVQRLAGPKGPALQTNGAPDLQVRGDGSAGPKGPALPFVSALTPDERVLVDRVLAAGALEMPSDVRALIVPVGTLLGPVATSVRPTPLGPIGTAVRSASPEFFWRAMDGAASYTVAVYDERFNELMRSPKISGTAWTPTLALPRGVTLAWQLTAHLADRDVIAPAPPQPEARFRVVTDETAAAVAVQETRLAAEPVALGVVLANAGLVTDAERVLTRAAGDASAETAARAKALLASLRK